MSHGTLTIGRRIALGFALVFILLGVIAAVAWFALGASGRKLAQFAGTARETNMAATLESSMLELKLHVNEFLATPTADHVKAYQDSKHDMDRQLTQASQHVEDIARQQQLTEATKFLADYDSAFQRVVENSRKLDEIGRAPARPAGRIDGRVMQKALGDAKGSGDMNGAFKISNALKAYFESSSFANSFMLTSKQEYADSAQASIKLVADAAQKLQKDQEELVKMDASLKDGGEVRYAPRATHCLGLPSTAVALQGHDHRFLNEHERNTALDRVATGLVSLLSSPRLWARVR